MKTKLKLAGWIAGLLLVAGVGRAWGDGTPFPPASQAQVNAGQSAVTFVSPATLAGTALKANGATTNWGLSGVLFVSTSGNDGTAVRGDSTHPWLTAANAILAATNYDTIQFGSGTFNEVNPVLQGVTIVGSPNLGTSLTNFTGVGGDFEIESGNNTFNSVNFPEAISEDPNGLGVNNVTLNNCSIGTLSAVDAFINILAGFGGLTVNNCRLYGNCDFSKFVANVTWYNDTFLASDQYATPSTPARAHVFDVNGGAITVIGGTVTILSTNLTLSANTLSNCLFFFEAGFANNSQPIQIAGLHYNHYSAPGANPIVPFYFYGVNPTNLVGYYWDNDLSTSTGPVLTYVQGTNIYPVFSAGVHTGNFCGRATGLSNAVYTLDAYLGAVQGPATWQGLPGLGSSTLMGTRNNVSWSLSPSDMQTFNGSTNLVTRWSVFSTNPLLSIVYITLDMQTNGPSGPAGYYRQQILWPNMPMAVSNENYFSFTNALPFPPTNVLNAQITINNNNTGTNYWWHSAKWFMQ
jgi:hypothetical protein